MNQFKCRHCSRDAYWYFREGGMLCPDHGALHATAQMKDMLERSRLDKSVSPESLSGECAAAGVSAGAPTSVVAANSACLSLDGVPDTTTSDLPVGLDGTPAQERPSAFFNRKNATTFRVTADNSIQESM